MGDVVGFRKKRLTGFLPCDLGRDALPALRVEQIERDRMIDLIGFARKGAPPNDLTDNLA